MMDAASSLWWKPQLMELLIRYPSLAHCLNTQITTIQVCHLFTYLHIQHGIMQPVKNAKMI